MARSIRSNVMCDECNLVKPQVVWSGPDDREVYSECYDCMYIAPEDIPRYEELEARLTQLLDVLDETDDAADDCEYQMAIREQHLLQAKYDWVHLDLYKDGIHLAWESWKRSQHDFQNADINDHHCLTLARGIVANGDPQDTLLLLDMIQERGVEDGGLAEKILALHLSGAPVRFAFGRYRRSLFKGPKH